MTPSVSSLFNHPAHAGQVDGADRRGLARAADGHVVELALFDGAPPRARFKATACVALVACAERACQLISSGLAPEQLDGALLRAHLGGLHPRHSSRADLVVRALAAALAAHPSPGAQP